MYHNFQHFNFFKRDNSFKWIGTLLITLATMVTNAQPIISSFDPISGPIGATVTITGNNFNSDTASNVVFFGATRANVQSASTTSLVVTVPFGATYQPISVINTGTNLIGSSSGSFEVTYNSGIGQSINTNSFSPLINFNTGANPAGIIAVADIDGDGKPDMVVVNRSTNTFSVLKNTSSVGNISKSSFATKVDFATDSTPCFVKIGDLDGDGKQDIVIVNMFTNKVSVYRNTSTVGTITSSSFASKVNFISDSLSMPTSVAIGDLDGDGKPELVVTNSFSNSVSVLKNTSHVGILDSTSFAPSTDFTTGLGPSAVAISDINGDGKPDLIVANFDAKTISIFKNKTTLDSITKSSFAAKVDFKVGTCPNAIAVGDLNNDGKVDVVVVNQANGTLSIIANTSTIATIDSTSLASQVVLSTNGSSPYFVTIGNVDSDSLPDIVVANLVSNNITIFKNLYQSGSITTSSFAGGVRIAAGNFPVSVAIADFNGDGIPDLAVPEYGNNTISVYQNLSQNILPVTFESFTASYQGNGESILNWKIANEINTTYFNIERSHNGVDFSQVGRVNEHGLNLTYVYKDILPLVNTESTLYYRLQSVDQVGVKTYSNTVALNLVKPSSFNIYPNPAKSILNIESNELLGNPILLITDLSGHVILTNRLFNQKIQQIGIDNLSKGIYNLTIYTVSGRQTRKLIVE